MSYAVLDAVVASLRAHVVPRVLGHPRVFTALIGFAQKRGGEALCKKIWTLAAISHATRGAVALDMPADVSQVVATTQDAVALELDGGTKKSRGKCC